MIDSQTLGLAILDLYAGALGASLRAYVGNSKMFQIQAPQGAGFPYIVFNIIDDMPMDSFSNEMSESRVQFSIFAEIGVTNIIGSIERELKLLYSDNALTFTNHYGHFGSVLQSSHSVGIIDNIQHYVLDYIIYSKKQTLQDACFGDLKELSFGDLKERSFSSFKLSVWK